MSMIDSGFGMNALNMQRNAMNADASRKSDAMVAPLLGMMDAEPSEAAILRAGAVNGSMAEHRQDYASEVLNTGSDIIGRIGQLTTRATDGSLSSVDRQALNDEAISLRDEMQGMFDNAKFNGSSILQGGTVNTHIDGATSFADANGNNVTAGLAGLDLTTQAGAQAAVTQVRDAGSNLVAEQVKAGNAAASMSRQSDLASLKAGNIESVSARQSGDLFMQVVQQIGTSRVEQAKMAHLNKELNSMKTFVVDAII